MAFVMEVLRSLAQPQIWNDLHCKNKHFEKTCCSVNTLRPMQNGRHFPDDIFKRIFLNQNVRIPIYISLEFVSKGPINNIPALVQIMAWRRPGDKPLSETMLVSLLTHICVTRPQWVNLENHIFRNIFSFKACHLYLDTGSNIYLGELSVGHRTSISSLSFSIMCAVITFQHVEKVFPDRCY